MRKFDLKISSNIQIRFGVPWLDEWFSMALDDEKLGETFLRFPFIILIGFRLCGQLQISHYPTQMSSYIAAGLNRIHHRVSDELGHLVAGQHKAGRGRKALLHLLGPAFVGRHLRIHWTEDLQTSPDYNQQNEDIIGRRKLLSSKDVGSSQNERLRHLRSGRTTTSRSRAQSTRASSGSREWSAKHIRVREELAAQAGAALAKVPPDEIVVVEEELKEGLERALANAEMQYRWGGGTAASDASSLLNFSLRSQVSSCGEQRQELVGEALAALLEVDEADGDQKMIKKTKQTFGATCLPLPGELRHVFWEEEYIGRQCRRKGKSREELWQDWVGKLQRPSSDMAEMARVWVARQHTLLPHLSSWEQGRGEREQLLSVHVLSLICNNESDLAMLFWLQPLQLIFLEEEDQDVDDERRVLELGWRLHLLQLHSRLSDRQVHQLVDGIWRDLGRRDPEFTFHLASLGQVMIMMMMVMSLMPALARQPSGWQLKISSLMCLLLETKGLAFGANY